MFPISTVLWLQMLKLYCQSILQVMYNMNSILARNYRPQLPDETQIPSYNVNSTNRMEQKINTYRVYENGMPSPSRRRRRRRHRTESFILLT